MHPESVGEINSISNGIALIKMDLIQDFLKISFSPGKQEQYICFVLLFFKKSLNFPVLTCSKLKDVYRELKQKRLIVLCIVWLNKIYGLAQ